MTTKTCPRAGIIFPSLFCTFPRALCVSLSFSLRSLCISVLHVFFDCFSLRSAFRLSSIRSPGLLWLFPGEQSIVISIVAARTKRTIVLLLTGVFFWGIGFILAGMLLVDLRRLTTTPSPGNNY